MAATRAFIVRPFGTKDGIDFDRVERELIAPALQKAGIEGRTTGEITRQGNIREDMFRLLVLSDLVIADVSIYNANVFYELGIRHGLRDQHTLLIRAEGTKDKYPFDLQTDRYGSYDAANPAAALPGFAAALRATLSSTIKDSPVFQLLPRLVPHDRAALMVVPFDFQEDVAVARRAARAGDLRLFAEEVRGLEWGSGGLRVVGDAQFQIKAFGGARETFEGLRELDPVDLQANYRLGTVYQKLAGSAVGPGAKLDYLTRSEQAIQRVLDRTMPPTDHVETPAEAAERRFNRAEGHSLLGSNAKTRWIDDWSAAATDARRTAALRSPRLADSIQHYLDGFAEDLDSFYPAVNALAMLTIQITLAKALPDVWAESFDDTEAALADLKASERRAGRIAATLQLALGNDDKVVRDGEQPNTWRDVSRADLLFLTSDRPAQVGAAYRKALANARPLEVDSVRRNVLICRDLAVLSANADAALREMGPQMDGAPPTPARVILFTGHMLDAPGRPGNEARFPATPEAVAEARRLIMEAVKNELGEAGGVAVGIAGGACGGDILFHEVCETLNVPTRLFLALPEAQFQEESVNRGGLEWVTRYQQLCQSIPPRILADSSELPRWLREKKDYDIWKRNNLWMLFNALAEGARSLTLIALNNRDVDPDGAGGTAHLIGVAASKGFKIVELDARRLLHVGRP
ncbi:hypothetical protein ABIF38_000762 [Bradyrhizobium japonicum]|uniref:DUF4071 domain-containing protein n=1 Tax=Bradyrhizobium elkanii TaxID=29448 RepID=A0ABV4ES26_BRAEL|nr:tetratricopeptide repeat-containing protein [Bradyrhizobium elkanii]MBP2429607.1 hypothetical protein [Bradyrhizobium elkanii]MCP1736921.1 hypothetical protein [Bradyrhizobium elkanii]MCP1754966.1 hypothetical protein [Bradyrhizobium elkanii]MCP1980484.1 hypothetical protein [Bradyrhizobium elkanii]MCS3572261.1 hypothetical protein [Bradyrhizobium elkanii]